MEVKDIQKLGDELQTGLKALQDAHEKQKQDTDTLIKGQVDRIAEDLGQKLETLQTEQAKMQAVIERVGTDGEEKAEDKKGREEKEAFLEYVRRGDARKLSDAQVKALSTDSQADGGYMVPKQMLGKIDGRIFETSPLRRVANVIRTGAKSVEMIIDDQEAGFDWAGEGDTVSDTSTPKLGKLEIVAKKAQAYPKATVEMVADSVFDVERWLIEKVGDVIARGENTAFVNGSGVEAPRGFLTYPSSSGYERGKLEQVSNSSTSAPTVEGLISLQGALKEPYQARAVWAMKRATFVEAMKLKGTDMFRFLNLQPADGKQGSAVSDLFLLGKPVILMDDMPTIASNSLSVAYGDFGVGYTIVDRAGLTVQADPYTAPGFIKWYFTKRTGGAVTNFEAIKLLKFSA